MDWLGYKFPALERILQPAAVPLIKHGRMLKQNMQQEMITPDELLGQLREQGIERVEDVKQCCLEGDGHISVIKKDGKSLAGKKTKQLTS